MVGRRNCLTLAETGNLHVVDLEVKYTTCVTISCTHVVPEMPSKYHIVLHIAVGWQLAAAVVKDLDLTHSTPAPFTPEENSLTFNSEADGIFASCDRTQSD